MITNSEAIEILYDSLGGRKDLFEDAFNIAISALEENTKLKAEIEQLKADCKDEMSMANAYTEIMVNQRKEIERLKSELEQSVKLPCKKHSRKGE